MNQFSEVPMQLYGAFILQYTYSGIRYAYLYGTYIEFKYVKWSTYIEFWVRIWSNAFSKIIT